MSCIHPATSLAPLSVIVDATTRRIEAVRCMCMEHDCHATLRLNRCGPTVVEDVASEEGAQPAERLGRVLIDAACLGGARAERGGEQSNVTSAVSA